MLPVLLVPASVTMLMHVLLERSLQMAQVDVHARCVVFGVCADLEGGCLAGPWAWFAIHSSSTAARYAHCLCTGAMMLPAALPPPPPPPSLVAPRAVHMLQRTQIETMKKTRLCEEFMKTASCKYGNTCTFAHG